VHRHGLDIAVEAVYQLRERIPTLHLDICGEGTAYLDSVLALARERGIHDRITYHGPLPQGQIAGLIAVCDLGIIPNRRSAFTELNMPTRIFEYLAMGKPVIAPNTRGIRDYFVPGQLLYFEPDGAENLASRIEWVHQHPGETMEVVRNGIQVYQSHRWQEERSRFLELIGRQLA
jgi:glycosyltransferase involved in cell wall biosynthesis